MTAGQLRSVLTFFAEVYMCWCVYVYLHVTTVKGEKYLYLCMCIYLYLYVISFTQTDKFSASSEVSAEPRTRLSPDSCTTYIFGSLLCDCHIRHVALTGAAVFPRQLIHNVTCSPGITIFFKLCSQHFSASIFSFIPLI